MHNVIVLGGSAGALRSLCSLLAEIPADLPAALMAVIHTTQKSSFLPEVLGRCSRMEVISPAPTAPLQTGRVYIAQPNRHLLVKSHCAVSWMGPRENRHRPAVDTLFRSAARVYRSRVIGVVLSGALDDGSAGSLAIKARGGTVIVQDPGEAMVSDMPANVLRDVKTDLCLPLAEIPQALIRIVNRSRPFKHRAPSVKECATLSVGIDDNEKEPQGFSCPECDGVLLEIKNGKEIQYRCHVGHNFSLESFSEAHADALERTLWVALRRLNEQRTIQENLGKGSSGNPALRKRYQENAAAADRDIRLLHEILARL